LAEFTVQFLSADNIVIWARQNVGIGHKGHR